MCDTALLAETLCLEVILTTAILCLQVSLPLIFAGSNNLSRIVANTTKYSHITPVRQSLHSLPMKHHSVFKTTLLVHKFLHSGYPKTFL